jgi:putative membrane protein insertion efficiency factor
MISAVSGSTTGPADGCCQAQPEARGGAATRLLVAAIRGYQLVRIGRVSPCRFTPTCSEYAAQALTRYGARRGLSLTVRRLGRCRPGGPSGFDPVPDDHFPRVRTL